MLAGSALFAQAPRIDSLLPNQGPIAGGTEVVIRGANLTGAPVSVDLLALTPSSVSSSEIRFRTPAHHNGYAIVRAGSATARFLYTPPRLQDLPPGYITTIAGVGNYYGDYGPAREAAVEPFEIAIGSDGSIYGAEPAHDRVIRIRPDGILEPFAGSGLQPDETAEGDGGPALRARIGFPRSVLVENNGDVVIADGGRNRVWRVEAATGLIRVIAGTGEYGFSGDGGPARAAQLNRVGHLTGDGRGTIWFVDFANSRIRRITPDGTIATICGTGTAGFSGDGGPAVLAQFNVDLDDFGALAYDPSGLLYLADRGNQRIRRIDLTTGIINTFLAPGMGFGMSGLVALLVEPGGNLYFSANGVIYHVTRAGQIIEQFGVYEQRANPPRLDGTPINQVQPGSAKGLALDSGGNLVYSDSEVLRILRLNRVKGVLETMAGIGPALPGDGASALTAVIERGGQGYADVVALPNGEILYSGPRIRKIGLDGRVSIVAGNGLNAGRQENAPATEAAYEFGGLELGADGNIYAATLNTVVRIDRTGVLRIVAAVNAMCGFSGDGGPARQASLCQPFDVARDAEGNLFIADTNNNRVRRVDAQTQVITTVAGSGPVNGFEKFFQFGSTCGDGGLAVNACVDTPGGVTITPNGELLISGRSYVRKVDRNGIITKLAGGPTGNYTNMTSDPAGSVYALYSHAVVRIRPDGRLQYLAGGPDTEPGFSGDGGPATQAQVSPPGSGITIDAEGNLIFVDGMNRRIRAIRYGAVLAPPNSTAQLGGGTPQSAPLSTAYSVPLSVMVRNQDGTAAGNVRVDFQAQAQGPSCTFAGQQARISVLTDRDGIAAATCTANTVPGTFTVNATPLGIARTLTFALTNTPPQLVSNSLVNAASFAGGPVAPGEIVTLFGSGIGPAALAHAAPVAGTFPTQLAGVRVRFNGVAAPMIYARFDQVAAVAPFALDGAASAQVQVEYAGVLSSTISVPVAAAAPAIFAADSSGRGQGAILNQDGSPNSPAQPEARGSIIVLFATGAGQTQPPGADGTLAVEPYPKPKLPVSVTIGGQTAEILYSGAAPGLVAGVLQVNARVPAAITPGPSVPVVLTVGGIPSPSGITAAVR